MKILLNGYLIGIFFFSKKISCNRKTKISITWGMFSFQYAAIFTTVICRRITVGKQNATGSVVVSNYGYSKHPITIFVVWYFYRQTEFSASFCYPIKVTLKKKKLFISFILQWSLMSVQCINLKMVKSFVSRTSELTRLYKTVSCKIVVMYFIDASVHY